MVFTRLNHSTWMHWRIPPTIPGRRKKLWKLEVFKRFNEKARFQEIFLETNFNWASLFARTHCPENSTTGIVLFQKVTTYRENLKLSIVSRFSIREASITWAPFDWNFHTVPDRNFLSLWAIVLFAFQLSLLNASKVRLKFSSWMVKRVIASQSDAD